MTPEQQARDMLERMGVTNAQSFTAGELAELANLINEWEWLRKPDWADDYARLLLKLKDMLAERGARPVTESKAVLWDEACAVYERMVKWANSNSK